MQPQGDVWLSPGTGARYPLRWNISVPSLGIDLVCTTPFREQEVVSQKGASPNYWEGAVDYTGRMSGKPVTGVGYLELTGYDKPVNLGDAGE
jgi:predicted secreted hydrolase